MEQIQLVLCWTLMTVAHNSGWVAFCVRSGLMFLMLNKAKWHNQETEAETYLPSYGDNPSCTNPRLYITYVLNPIIKNIRTTAESRLILFVLLHEFNTLKMSVFRKWPSEGSKVLRAYCCRVLLTSLYFLFTFNGLNSEQWSENNKYCLQISQGQRLPIFLSQS